MTLPEGYRDPRWIPIWEAHRRVAEGLNTLAAPANLVYDVVTWKPTYDKPTIINTPIGPRVEVIRYADGRWLAEMDMSIPTPYSAPASLTDFGFPGLGASSGFARSLGAYLRRVVFVGSRGIDTD
ncbi:MAG: hypothetical protein OXI16_00700 [Chloroflexota bacterium]|nr:hypothetical protein [Chloroflexota bacterium]MDE2686007.1 hypothetical protein [Chloroflexota bacterium]